MAELSLAVVAAPKGTGLDCEPDERRHLDRLQRVAQVLQNALLFRVSPPGHSNGHVPVGTNGHPAETLTPTDSVRWARPQPKMAFAPPYGGTASQAGSESVETNG